MNYAVIGDPISHSLSPIMHNANFKSLDMQDSYEALHVRKEDFHNIRNIIEDKRIVGFNVTIPYKESIIQYLDEIDDQSKAVGAVNTVKLLIINGLVITQMELAMFQVSNKYILI